MRARVVVLVVALVLAACGGGGGDDDDAAEGEEFIPPTTEETESTGESTTTTAETQEPAATLEEWGERYETAAGAIFETILDLPTAIEEGDFAAIGEHCEALGRAVIDARAIGPMPDPADSEWTLALDELETGATGCVAAVDAGDQAALDEALDHLNAAFLHMQNVSDALP